MALTGFRPKPLLEQGSSDKVYLAFSFMPSANSGLITYAIVCVHEKTPRQVIYITRNEFLRQATGQTISEANPLKENLFTKHEIPDCGYYNDSIAKRLTYECSVVDNLWKLRYGPFPERSKSKVENGWARGKDNFPTDGQLAILYQYGIERLSELIVGEKAFKLLKDMQNPEWVANYLAS